MNNAILKNAICEMFRSRIISLKTSGIMNLYMRMDGDDLYTIGPLLGYCEEDWEMIVKYSGLWRSDGNCLFDTWSVKLRGIGVDTRKSHVQSASNQGLSKWFIFTDIISDSSTCTRASRSDSSAEVKDSRF